MLFGSHVSAAGGVEHAPERAHEVGCEVFQFFSRSPRGGTAPKLTQAQVKLFKQNCKKFKQSESYIHAPYYINFASSNNRIRYGSSAVLREELERGSMLGVKYLMTHLGSAGDLNEAGAVARVIEGVGRVLEGYTGTTQFLLENSAGAGKVIGDSFTELAAIIAGVERQREFKGKLGVCFDTCHAFTSGYDLRNEASVNKTLAEFDKQIGLDRLKLIHCNDSQAGLGEHKDRHEHLGQGKIGLVGFKALVKHKQLEHVNLILETPKDNAGDDPRNLAALKRFRGK